MENFIASNIRFLRKREGMSQKDLADKTGLNRGNITSYERNIATPTIATLQKLSALFNVGLNDLVEIDLSQNEGRILRSQSGEPTKNPSDEQSKMKLLYQQELNNNVANIANQLSKIHGKMDRLIGSTDRLTEAIDRNNPDGDEA